MAEEVFDPDAKAADDKAAERKLALDLDPIPCPFCGSGRMLKCEHFGVFFITCEDCEVDGPPAGTMDDAKVKWNVRRYTPVSVSDAARG